MFLSRLRRSPPISQISGFRHLLHTSDITTIDVNQFRESLCKLYTYLTPYESLEAVKILNLVKNRQHALSTAELNEAQHLLINNIRSKLYVLADVNELCTITLGITNNGILNKQYLSDFISRLGRLMSSVTAENVSLVSDSLIQIHFTGNNVVNVTRKFLLHLVTKKIVAELDCTILSKLLACISELNIDYKPINIKIASTIKERVKNRRVSLEDAINILDLNHSNNPNLLFINHLLMRTVIAEKCEMIQLDALVRFLSTCNFPFSGLDKIDETIKNRIYELPLASKLELLYSYGKLRHKPPFLDALTVSISEKARSVSDFRSYSKLLWSLFLLDIYDHNVLSHFVQLLVNMKDSISSLDPKSICDVLVACSYFRVNQPFVYNTLIFEVIRFGNTIGAEMIKELQLVEIMIRSNYIDGLKTFHLNDAVLDFLSSIKDKDVAEVITSSPLKREIGKTGTFISHTLIENVKIGPYFIDFLNPISFDSHTYIDEDKLDCPPQNLGSGIAILVEDFRCLYHKSNDRTSFSLLRENIMKRLGIMHIKISQSDWRKLEGWAEKREYLEYAISKCKSQAEDYKLEKSISSFDSLFSDAKSPLDQRCVDEK